MLVLGIESTCDETACSVVRDGKEILSNVIASQAQLHEIFGGVVPELACRNHVDLIIPVIDRAIREARIALSDIDLIAVAYAPGLIGALLIGLNAAKSLSIALNKPFIGINHIEAHLYAAIMSHSAPISYPCLGVILSGGHTSLVVMHAIGDYQLVAETIDDAIGEAFDKVAKMMGLPYPGGPQIELLAKEGNAYSYPLKPGTVKDNPLSFSFSGLKTAVLYSLGGQNAGKNFEKTLTREEKCNMAATFQRVALEDVLKKTLIAAEKFNCKTLVFGGGVTNNQMIRKLFKEKASHLELLWPLGNLSLDNAAMIAGLGYHKYKLKTQGDPLEFEAKSRIDF